MKALKNFEFLDMDAFFVSSRGTLSCGAGKKQRKPCICCPLQNGPGKNENLFEIAQQVKNVCLPVHQLYSMQLGITLKIVALSTSDLKITYGSLFYMLKIACIVKYGGKMHIWCLLAWKKSQGMGRREKSHLFFAFCVSCGKVILGRIFLSQFAKP